jgi:hypothetical protein
VLSGQESSALKTPGITFPRQESTRTADLEKRNRCKSIVSFFWPPEYNLKGKAMVTWNKTLQP